MNIRVVFLLSFSFLLFSATFTLYGAGQGDRKSAGTIEDAEKLVSEKRYDEAIIVLVEIVRNDPEQMERAQSLINNIKKVRDRYNAKYEELIIVLFDEEDYERSLALIEELETLDNNPNDATQSAIKEARVSAELVYFRQVFNEIMNRGRELIVQGDYREAVRIYRTGFNLYRRTFDETEYGNIIKDPVYRDLDLITSDIETFSRTYDELSRIALQGVRIVSTTDPDQLDTTMAPVYTVFNRFQSYRERAEGVADTFSEQNTRIRNLGEGMNEDFFLSFMERILLGRAQIQWREGVAEAMALYWESQLYTVVAAAESRADSLYNEGLALFSEGRWNAASRVFKDLENLSREGERIAELTGSNIQITPSGNLSPGALEITARFAPPYEKFRHYRKASLAYSALCSAGRNLDLAKNANPNDYNALMAANDTMEENLGLLTGMTGNWDQLQTRKNPLAPAAFLAPLTETVLTASRKMTDDYEKTRTGVVTGLARLDMNPLGSRYTGLADRENQSALLIAGTEDPESGELIRYPRRGILLIDETLPLIDILITDLQNYVTLYRTRRTGLTDTTQIDRYILQAENWITSLEAGKGRLAALYASAQDAVYEAGRLVTRGDQLLEQARQEMNNDNYENAFNRSTEAYDAYVQALNFDEDVLERGALQQRTDTFNRSILEEWNRYVIVTVRGMINTGSTQYYQGSYIQSETTFKSAETLWSKTNPDNPNPEIVRWLGLVRNALSANTGRSMTEADPLYGEVAQLLNLAYRYYEEGKKLLTRNNKTDGLRALASAQEYIRQITVLFPLNQEASILGLRIEQVRDEKVFYQRFSEMFNAAREKIRTGVLERKREAYNDLRDLSAVLPDYPGLRGTIIDLEYDLGIRQRPVNTTRMRESDEYYRRALGIVRTDDRRQFRLAESYLKTAINLNPENQPALELLDQVMIYTGGTAVYALNTRDQAQFREAEEKYRNGEYYVARDIVNRLLENEKNRRYAPLLELKRSIDSRI